jgi:hypothetical protein
MTLIKLVLAGLRYHWRSHAGAFAGAALCAMVLVGSLLVGDSLRGTLRDQARSRTGSVLSALVGGERTFRTALAAEIAADVSPVLLLRGSASRADGSARLNQVQVLGVDPTVLGARSARGTSGTPAGGRGGEQGVGCTARDRAGRQPGGASGEALGFFKGRPAFRGGRRDRGPARTGGRDCRRPALRAVFTPGRAGRARNGVSPPRTTPGAAWR